MNHDFLTQIRTTESEAVNLVEKARQQARLKTQEAREKAAQELAQTNQQALHLQQKIQEESEQEAEKIRNQAQQQAQTEVEKLQQLSSGKIPEAAGLIAERIVNDCANC